MTPATSARLVERLREKADALGFDDFGICEAQLGPDVASYLQEFVEAGHHGTMSWLAERMEQRASPTGLWPEVRSVIALGLSYAPEDDALATLDKPDCGNISVSARNRDYHDIIKGRLKHLAQFLVAEARRLDTACEVKVFVDTAPVAEKPLAEKAGLGWQGKHTNLVSRNEGSWLLLGEIYTTLLLPPTPHRAGSCGTCTRCITACPTQAITAPCQLDARRCVSYLTIEHDGPIPESFRKAIGNRIYGCDDCLAVCPWNRFAATAREMKLHPRPDLIAPRLADLAALDDPGFRKQFSGSPIKRIGRNRFVRNVLIAIGNSGDPRLLPVAKARQIDADPVVAEAAAWACGQLEALLS
ncbi:iron-sulfur binding protein [Acetobacter estunensis NRIC 0472]|uniref:Epoxyqueuosine reductase n=1 Tax=Acetobacter estunensis TaxID=104097 RepID=A0A967B4N0_9PROT|nr:tRNA epoxyqueuosine(34) reductase QueG [Acetobacter estunensis]NHO53682.1 tRNA epoxyqueuosine(34) reductase QueG [Acetobacter estunensis]GBQ25217.1 iron-sulfur binding protein [Acetobacter estunensis NRIC 0472]